MVYEFPVVPCKYFEVGVGCSRWCNKNDGDCCVLCCRRHECEKENNLCPIAKKILEMDKFKDKVYPWEIQTPEERKEWFGDEED